MKIIKINWLNKFIVLDVKSFIVPFIYCKIMRIFVRK